MTVIANTWVIAISHFSNQKRHIDNYVLSFYWLLLFLVFIFSSVWDSYLCVICVIIGFSVQDDKQEVNSLIFRMVTWCKQYKTLPWICTSPLDINRWLGSALNDKKHGRWRSWYSGLRLRLDIHTMSRVPKPHVANHGNEWHCEDGDLNDRQ